MRSVENCILIWITSREFPVFHFSQIFWTSCWLWLVWNYRLDFPRLVSIARWSYHENFARMFQTLKIVNSWLYRELQVMNLIGGGISYQEDVKQSMIDSFWCDLSFPVRTSWNLTVLIFAVWVTRVTTIASPLMILIESFDKVSVASCAFGS
jgi:hypothetical protein